VVAAAQPPAEQKYRWVVPAHGSVQFRVKFASVAEGKPESAMEFEVVGTHQKFVLPCKGVCEFPSVNTDTRNIFMRRVKNLSANPHVPLPNKRFVIADNFYSFGPLSLFKKPEWKVDPTDSSSADEKDRMAQIQSTNMDVLRVTNSGLYRCQVDVGLLTREEDSREVFLIDPPKLELDEGETKEVKLWALPREAREYRNDLVLSVSNNPAPLVFPLKCWGTDPTLEIAGPWGDAVAKAEKALADNTDKKLVKDLEAKLAALKDALTLDFERILIGKSDTREFTITNKSLLPIEWEIDLGDFKDSANISISPTSGVLPINTTLPVVITFTSPDPLMLTGKFSLRYADNEGGLRSTPPRFTTTKFSAVAEAYKITAVSLNSQGSETGGSEIDFGLMRVGDNAVQMMKMGNKGKYQIGYAFKLTTPQANNELKIHPMEGLIEAGNALAEIKVTFCAKDGELLLKNNKDVMVEIIEPLTKEVVERFPLFISAQAKYTKFRLQPSKGVSFGAVRFDSDHKTKRVELRNEGAFEMTYVICPAIAEHDELDSLDASAFACYAQGVPQALRAGELGDTYVTRAKGADAAAAGGKGAKKTEKPPAKGKGAAPAPTTSTLNPLVVDPDELPQSAPPEDPMVVGAFTVTPRIGVVQPGQSVGIDMKFDPSGCETVKERMRLCVSGADPKDALTVTVKTFEVTGESCVPAIVTDDVNNIFEEQEIVHSLADSTGEKSSEGGGKVEKLAVGKVVYAETEKMLAFGPVSCSLASGRGVVERVKISNPTKIDIKVKFNVLTPEEAAERSAGGSGAAAAGGAKDVKGKAAAAGKSSKNGPPVVEEPKPNAFTVHPPRWEIPPHEHRFVNVYFNPTEIRSYRSVFLAQIDDDGTQTSAVAKAPNSGKNLTFELGGSGTLPCIAFDQPTEFTASGDLLVKFGRVLVNRSNRKKLVIRNDGVMPATCLFDMVGDDDFVFPAKGTSLTVGPGCKEEVTVSFSPKMVLGDGNRKGTIKVSVLNNQFDSYRVQLAGSSYSCDAIVDTVVGDGLEHDVDEGSEVQHDVVPFADINLAEGPGKSAHTVLIRSKCEAPVRFSLARGADVPDVLDFSPSVGHLAPHGTREVTITFRADAPTKLSAAPVTCTFKRIAYKDEAGEQALWGVWDDSMKSARPAAPEDIAKIDAAAAALADYNAKAEAEKAKGKKGKPVGPPPERCLLELGPASEDGTQTIFEIVAEPAYEPVKDAPEQELSITCNGVADSAKYKCEGDGQNVTFMPTFLFQNTTHKFTLTNESNIKFPVRWVFEDLKRRGQTRGSGGTTSRAATASASSIPCPFSIDQEECEVGPNGAQQFTLKFFPLEVDDFMYLLRGVTLVAPGTGDGAAANSSDGPSAGIRMVIRGTAKRPICHFDIEETEDYMSRRPLNMKNEIGLNSPIEVTDIKVVELESVGLRTRNTFRFYVTNPTNDNYEFLWETMGEPSPFWRCVQGAGMMFAGKRVEVVFEYLPDDVNVAEAFYKFRIPSMGLEQVFLFTGKVSEPKVLFSTSRIDFHSVMLGGEGSSETIYLENKEHLPFQFAIDKYSLLQLDGPNGPVLDIVPKQGTVPPHGRMAIQLHFQPQEEVIYNFNIVCTVKRKPNKLSLNIKGEGYAVHPFIQLEGAEDSALTAVVGGGDVASSTSSVSRYMTLRPAPAVNYADFGAVQVLDTIAKTLTVTNNGKFNFDYHWDIDNISPMLTLSGGKLGGTLLKADELNYKITFAPTREGPIQGSMLSFTVAGKYVYNILPRGSGVKPALRFSFMHHDFGACFVTSPGGSTVIEETVLHIVNHDPKSNIAVECTFQKTRALWAECAPTVIAPGGTLDVPIRFAPREVKDYAFVIPFVVNGATKVPVNILGTGINARLELVNGDQRRTNFGLVNVGSATTRSVALVNRSKRALPVELVEETDEYGSGALKDRCVSFQPKGEFVIAPRETVTLQLSFNPNKRIAQFTEDLSIRYAGVTRKLLTLSGKAQGTEIALDSDSLPFGIVVLDSQKVKKLTLENTGDLTITYQWQESTFGKHFTITPLSGKILPGNEASFDVTFKPKFADEDIRQDGITLTIPGIEPLKLTCTGGCVPPPAESTRTLEFKSLARKAQEKTVKIQNPTDKDWYLSPSLQGDDWKVPHEFKVPARGAADLTVTYFPLTMTNNPNKPPPSTAGSAPSEPVDPAHRGQLFIALPDGSAQLYKLRGEAGAPECSGQVSVETAAKKPATVILRVKNWLAETQRLDVAVNLTEKPTPASFIVAANVTEIGPNGTKEFPLRYGSQFVVFYCLRLCYDLFTIADSSRTRRAPQRELSPSLTPSPASTRTSS
jgi:hydrocephalus-inducing protein